MSALCTVNSEVDEHQRSHCWLNACDPVTPANEDPRDQFKLDLSL